jgi:hypothetical protein
LIVAERDTLRLVVDLEEWEQPIVRDEAKESTQVLVLAETITKNGTLLGISFAF